MVLHRFGHLFKPETNPAKEKLNQTFVKSDHTGEDEANFSMSQGYDAGNNDSQSKGSKKKVPQRY